MFHLDQNIFIFNNCSWLDRMCSQVSIGDLLCCFGYNRDRLNMANERSCVVNHRSCMVNQRSCGVN